MDAAFPRVNRFGIAAGPVTVTAIVVALACFRLAHVHLLWSDEDYHLTAAIQMLAGKVPYRDFWYDKPPLTACYYLLIAGHAGWPLRLLDAAYTSLACYLAYRLAHVWWSRAEGWAAALLLAFFTTFYLPAAVIPFAADAAMLVPHLAAMYCAARGRALPAGIWAGIALLTNAKGLFVLAACAVWVGALWPWLLAGCALPVIAGFLFLLTTGAWPGYLEQVWLWSAIYAGASPSTRPFLTGVTATLHWLGFHAALALPAAFALNRLRSPVVWKPGVWKSSAWKLGAWLAVSFAAVCLGGRFAPRYYLQLLPPLAIIASRGLILAWGERRRSVSVVLPALLLVPLLRFGPRYAILAYDNIAGTEPQWNDIALDLDSQRVARQISAAGTPGDTLFVWGYRPDIYVYTRLPFASRFWDSQPLTGVPADRHLSLGSSIYGGPASVNRGDLVRSRPTWIVDGLGLLNSKLAPGVYPELRPWLARYKLVARTNLSLIYRRLP